ncbi:MAG: sialidase family protein [Kiritimatiellia bacterium]
MKTITLNGLKVSLGKPVVIGEGVGHFWFPCSADRFPTGEILVRWQICPDSGSNLVSGCVNALSADEGATWPFRYDTAANPLLRLARADGTIAGTGFRGPADPPGQARRMRFHYIVLSEGGRRYTLEPNSVFIDSFPRDLARSQHEGKWSREWPLGLAMNPDSVRQGNAVLATPYVTYAGEKQPCVVAIESLDEGRSWKYVSQVFAADALPDMRDGASEASVVKLANGDLLCVARTYSKEPLIEARSSDGGRTWSAAKRIAPYSVYPCLRLMDNGTLALSTGRMGLFLWLSAGGRGDDWQMVDITAHHNSVMDANHRIRTDDNPPVPGDPARHTTAYTQLVLLDSSRSLLIYDRYAGDPVPLDSEERSRIYALPVRIDRT